MTSKTFRIMSVAVAIVSSLLVAGCGGSGTFSPTITGGGPVVPATVTVSPSAVTLTTGQQQQFTVKVTGTNQPAVSWTVTGGANQNPGSISAGGLYQAPNNIVTKFPSAGGHKSQGEQIETVTVTATLISDNDVSGTATITLTQGED